MCGGGGIEEDFVISLLNHKQTQVVLLSFNQRGISISFKPTLGTISKRQFIQIYTKFHGTLYYKLSNLYILLKLALWRFGKLV